MNSYEDSFLIYCEIQKDTCNYIYKWERC